MRSGRLSGYGAGKWLPIEGRIENIFDAPVAQILKMECSRTSRFQAVCSHGFLQSQNGLYCAQPIEWTIGE